LTFKSSAFCFYCYYPCIPFTSFLFLAFGLHRLLVRPSERLSFIIFALYLPLEHSGVCVVYRLSAVEWMVCVVVGRGLVVVSGGATWGCPLDWILEGDSVGCMRLRGARHGSPHKGASAPRSHGFDGNMLPVHLDGIRAVAVIGSEPEIRVVASHSDGLGCGVHMCSSGVAGLVVDTGASGIVEGAGGDWGMHAGA
jgi:hypothetical protein